MLQQVRQAVLLTASGRTAAAAATTARLLLEQATAMPDVWRLVIGQLIDDYTSALARDGAQAAAAAFADEPAATGDTRVDAALAALAEHLSRRDGWHTPVWALNQAREASPWWFVTPLVGLHAKVLVESPLSFRKRGVFISADGLSRV
jgi:hypothetical protein